MRHLCFLIAALVVVVTATNPDLDNDWEDFKQRYAKEYQGEIEEIRRIIWEDNVDYVNAHNTRASRGLHSFIVGINEYSDLTLQEFVTFMNGHNSSHQYTTLPPESMMPKDEDLPQEVDWRNKHLVTPVKNQKQCGSCWAFSATGSLEGQHAKKTGKLVSLSEQNLVDCDKIDHGCGGGLMDNAFRYIKNNKGIDTEASYPYTARDGPKCLFKEADIGATLTSHQDINSGDEKALQKAVATVGPISVAIDAGHRSFQMYKEGIYYEPECSSSQLDHGVLAVGYGTSQDVNTGMKKDYWLVKNSWGSTWGSEGYIKMSRNRKNNCGISTAASYPLV